MLTSRESQRKIKGAEAEHAGRTFEKSLSIGHGVYAEHGLARIVKLPVPTAPGRGGRFRVLTRRQMYDYTGTFGANAGPMGDVGQFFGLTIGMEAKQNGDVKTSLAIKDDGMRGGGVAYHQMKALAEGWRDFGVISVIVWMNGDSRLVLMPDRVLHYWNLFQGRVRRSIPAKEFTPFTLERYTPKTMKSKFEMVEDWLHPVRIWLAHNGRPCPAQSQRKDYDMINYRADMEKKTVTAIDAGGSEHTIDMEVMDQAMINQAAMNCETVDEFERRLKSIGSANE
jgi:hypothetical protein